MMPRRYSSRAAALVLAIACSAGGSVAQVPGAPRPVLPVTRDSPQPRRPPLAAAKSATPPAPVGCELPPPVLAPCQQEGPRAVSLNVTEPPFHADPTGHRDSSPAIQAAVDAFVQRCGPIGPGGEIVFPAGRYLVTRPIVLPHERDIGAPLHVRGVAATLVNAIPPGSGSQAVFLRPPLPDREPFGARGWSFEGLSFQGTNCPGSKGMELHGTLLLSVVRCEFSYLDVGLELRFGLAATVDRCAFTLCRTHGLVLADATWTGRSPTQFYGCNAAVVRGSLHRPCGADPTSAHCRGHATRAAIFVKDSSSVVIEESVFNGPRPFHVIEHLVTTQPAVDTNVKDLEIRRSWFEFYNSPPDASAQQWPDGNGLPPGEAPLPSYIRTNASAFVVVDGAFVQDSDPTCAPTAPPGRCVDRLFLDARSTLPGGRFSLRDIVGVPREMKFGAGGGQWLLLDNFAGLFDRVACAGGTCTEENVSARLVGEGRPAIAIDDGTRLVRDHVELQTLASGRNHLPFLQLGVSGRRTVAHFGADEMTFHVTPADAGAMASAEVTAHAGPSGWEFRRDVSLAGNRLLDATLDPRNAPPPDARPGQLWFNTARNRFEYMGSDERVHVLAEGGE